MRTARTIEAEWWRVLCGSVSTGTKQDEPSTGRAWAAVFHHVTTRSRLARFELYGPYIYLISHFFEASVNRGYWISGYGDTAVTSLLAKNKLISPSCNAVNSMPIRILINLFGWSVNMYVCQWGLHCRAQRQLQVDGACVRYSASASSWINIFNSFISTEFQNLAVLNIFKVFPVNIPPGYKYIKIQ
jgi:hypothetical protein